MAVLTMSDRELRRLEVLQDLDRQRLTPAAAGQLLGLERRQVFRLLKAYRIEGPTGLISKRRGRRSNRRKPEALGERCGTCIAPRHSGSLPPVNVDHVAREFVVVGTVCHDHPVGARCGWSLVIHAAHAARRHCGRALGFRSIADHRLRGD
jgi:Homeodomain-like domain